MNFALALRTVFVMAASVSILNASSTKLLAADKEAQQILAEIRMLQEQTQQLEVLFGSVLDTLKSSDRTRDEQAAVERKARADMKVQIETVAEDLRVSRERDHDANGRFATLAQELAAMREVLSSLTSQSSSTSPSLPRVSPSGPAGAVDSTLSFTSPQLLFENAYGDYAAGTYLLAVKGFETYLQYFPNSASAAIAQLYIGQSHEGGGNYKEALAAYDTVIANYPTSSETPVAYYKRAGVLERLGNGADARQSYEALQKLFPESDAAVRAKQALERLSKSR